jgi:hypothetical protein
MPLGTSGTIASGPFIVLGVLCLVILSVSLLRRTQQRRATGRDLTREQRARLRDQQELRTSLDELLTQLDEAAERIKTQINAQNAKLDAAVRAADERIACLTNPGRPAPPVSPVDPSSPPAAPANPQRIYTLADQGATPIAVADALQMPVGEVELILSLRNYAAQEAAPIKVRSARTGTSTVAAPDGALATL